ncbi:helix-turn-helix domain-containing protein [Coleofasciculus chthonoplastes]|nr:helix-turn-helix transcriptional regulator [Coleofasciculus chthonoplastes]
MASLFSPKPQEYLAKSDGVQHMNMNYEILGQRLRLARERSRISQTEAAQVIDVTAAALNQYESGKRRVDALT